MRQAQPALVATPLTLTPAMRARNVDGSVLPTPKKLKTEHSSEARRPAFRDLTNAQSPAVFTGSTEKVKGAVDYPSTRTVLYQEGADPLSSSDDESQAEEKTDVLMDEPASPSSSADHCFHVMSNVELLEADEELGCIIHRRLQMRQLQGRAVSNYLEEQTEVNTKIRAILVDWLIEIHHRYMLETETLFLAVHYVDRYLANGTTTRSQLQLVGLVALFIAAKFHEVEAVGMADLLYACNQAFTTDQIIGMERDMLIGLKFELAVVTIEAFLNYYIHELAVDRSVTHFAAWFAQSTLLQLPVLLCYLPSDLAASALFLAQAAAVNERPADEWILQWEATTENSFVDLLPCLEDLCTIIAHPSKKTVALQHKFAIKRHGRVSQQPVANLRSYLS